MKGKIWSSFMCQKKDGTINEVCIQDCPQDKMGDVIDLYHKYFMVDEPLQKLSGIDFNKDAKMECEPLLTDMLTEEGSHIVICVEGGTGTIAGASCMKLNIGQNNNLIPDVKFKTKEVSKLYQILGGMVHLCNIPKLFPVDKWYDDRGIIVHPDFRGFGIGSALVKSRKQICKEQGVPITCAWMTSIGTQKAAERDGWETVYEIHTKEFVELFDVRLYEGIAPTFKLMVWRP